ncbi:MAG: phosphatidylserine decarboxylase [Alphaproteobacteria bacterium]
MKPESIALNFNRAGWPFMAIFAVVTIILMTISCTLGWIGIVLTVWCCYFFRDPPRLTPARAGLIISPADGKVVSIQEVVPDETLGLGSESRIRISIFLNVFDVHVNRIPADGIVRSRTYRPGKFINASLDKASVDNERMALALQLTGDHPYDNHILGVVQIAGLVARRILCSAQEGNSYKAGERFGIIRFGSRADVYLPQGLRPLVSVGQYMIGGETVLADCSSDEAQRHAELRE